MLMKAYAFVRTNVPKALEFTSNIEKENSSDIDDNIDATSNFGGESPCPSFSSYLYFLFAPTLVYRDKYPR